MRQMNANEMIIRQSEAVTYGALYRSFLSNVAPHFVSLQNQFVHLQSIDLAKFSNDLQLATEGINAFNLALQHVSEEVKEGQLPPETLELVRVPQLDTQFLLEELQEAQDRGERLAICLAETKEENVELKNELAIATEKNDMLIGSLEHSDRCIQDLEGEIEKLKTPTANPMFG